MLVSKAVPTDVANLGLGMPGFCGHLLAGDDVALDDIDLVGRDHAGDPVAGAVEAATTDQHRCQRDAITVMRRKAQRVVIQTWRRLQAMIAAL